MPSVFLCHSSADKPRVKSIAAELQAFGASLWIDEAEIRVGDSLIDRIGQGIQGADYVAVFLSTSSINSHWVQHELRIAMAKEIKMSRVVVLPILLESVELPDFLRGKAYADFCSDEAAQASIRRLCKTLNLTPDQKIEEEERWHTGALIFLNSGRPVRLRSRDRRVKWEYDGDGMVRSPYRGWELYHVSGESYCDGDPIGPCGLFFADGTPADSEDIFYLYRWAEQLG